MSCSCRWATPEQKSELIKAPRKLGADVGFMGDGVNDAVALHDADRGISVQTATDVARDAADIVLLDNVDPEQLETAIRIRRVPFFRSRASKPLTITTLVCVVVGAYLPYSPLQSRPRLHALARRLFGFLVGMVILYLLLVEVGKTIFYRHLPSGEPLATPVRHKRAHHRASRWSVRRHHPAHRDNASNLPRRPPASAQIG